MTLRDCSFTDLVAEIRRRSLCSLVAVKLDEEHESSPEATLRVLMDCRKGIAELELLGLADVAMTEVRDAVRERIMGTSVDS